MIPLWIFPLLIWPSPISLCCFCLSSFVQEQNPLEIKNGKIAVPDAPGLGVELDWEQVQKSHDDIVIRIVRTCVCGSDLWFFRGLSGQAGNAGLQGADAALYDVDLHAKSSGYR